MKKWFIIFCLWVFPVFAQEISNDTFSENNPNLIRDNTPHAFTGGSLVYIQGISNKPQPKTWMDNVKVRLFGSMEIPDKIDSPELTNTPSIKNPSTEEAGIKTKDFFGTSKEIKYVDHTSNWDFIIQLMDNNVMSIQENIQFLLTKDTKIQRNWPIEKEKFSLISAQIDGHSIQMKDQNEKAQLNFDILPAGLHQINLHYTLSIPFNENFLFPLMGDSWPLTTDLLSGVILHGKTGLQEAHFLLGENNLEIPQSFTFQTDEQRNLFFKNNHILPAFTQIQLSGKTFDLAPSLATSAPFSLSASFIFMISLIIILLYLILSFFEVYFASLASLLKKFKHTSSNFFIRWIYRSGEITLGCCLLLILTFIISIFLHLPLPYLYWITLIISSIIGIFCLDVFVFYPKQKMIHQLHQNKMNQERK